MTTMTLEPVRKSIVVAVPQETAFRVFVDEIGRWWPLETHARLERVETAVVEPRVGGRVYERAADGEEASWADVVAYEPPARIVLAWKPNASGNPPTEVEVRFSAEGDGSTRVELEHRGWETLDEAGREGRPSYDEGWDIVLQRYREAVAS